MMTFLNKIVEIFTGTLQGNFWLIIFLFMIGVIRLYQTFGNTKMEEFEGHKIFLRHGVPLAAEPHLFSADGVLFGNVVFLKVDVDVAGDVAKKNGITGMPTFKLFKNGTMVEQVIGWDENRILSLIEKHKVVTPSTTAVGDITRRK